MRTCCKCQKFREDYYFTQGTKGQCVECHRAMNKRARENRRKAEAGLNKAWQRTLIVPLEQHRGHAAS